MDVVNSLQQFFRSFSGVIINQFWARLFTPGVEPPQPQPVPPDNQDWAAVIIACCFTSSIEIAVQRLQLQSQPPLSFCFLSMAMVFAFSSLFVGKYIVSRFRRAAQVLEHLGVFSAVTAYFLAITVSVPLCLKCISWVIYAFCWISIFICNSPKLFNTSTDWVHSGWLRWRLKGRALLLIPFPNMNSDGGVFSNVLVWMSIEIINSNKGLIN